MGGFNPAALLTQVHYAWSFRVMLGDIKDFLSLSEHNIEWQLLVEQQSIRRGALNNFGFDDVHLAEVRKEHLIENAEHRFTVALPMQIRYAALGALTNTTEWAVRSLQKRWKSLPKQLRNPEGSATSLLKYFATMVSLDNTNIVADYPRLVEVRNAVVHHGGIIDNYHKPKVLKRAVHALKGFSITDWHFLGECIKIDRGALDPYIECMSQLLEDIHKTAHERELLQS